MDAAPQHPAARVTPGSVTDQDAKPAHTPVSPTAPGIHTSYSYGYGDGYGDGDGDGYGYGDGNGDGNGYG